jgi:hypothetical protein
MPKKHKGWKRCWRGKLPKRARLLVFDSGENIALVDSRQEHFHERWRELRGTRIEFYIVIPKPPFESGWLFDQESVGRLAAVK